MSHVQWVNDVTGTKVFFRKLNSDETKFGTCYFFNAIHPCPVWLIRAQLTWLYSVSWAGWRLVVWNRPPSHPQMFGFFKTCSDQLTHVASAGARLCTALYVPIKGIVLSFICSSTQQQLAGEVTPLWCTKRRFIKSRSYLQKCLIACAYAFSFF